MIRIDDDNRPGSIPFKHERRLFGDEGKTVLLDVPFLGQAGPQEHATSAYSLTMLFNYLGNRYQIADFQAYTPGFVNDVVHQAPALQPDEDPTDAPTFLGLEQAANNLIGNKLSGEFQVDLWGPNKYKDHQNRTNLPEAEVPFDILNLYLVGHQVPCLVRVKGDIEGRTKLVTGVKAELPVLNKSFSTQYYFNDPYETGQTAQSKRFFGGEWGQRDPKIEPNQPHGTSNLLLTVRKVRKRRTA